VVLPVGRELRPDVFLAQFGEVSIFRIVAFLRTWVLFAITTYRLINLTCIQRRYSLLCAPFELDLSGSSTRSFGFLSDIIARSSPDRVIRRVVVCFKMLFISNYRRIVWNTRFDSDFWLLSSLFLLLSIYLLHFLVFSELAHSLSSFLAL
jgi:hypothetical protein